MAGAGFKDFAVGEVLTASDVDTYLMQQSVMRFADSAARGSALGTATGSGTALAEGMVSYLDDLNVVEVYTGSGWRAPGAGIGANVVVGTTSTSTSTTSTSYTATSLTASITPTSSSSKVLAILSIGALSGSNDLVTASLRLYRGATGLTGDPHAETSVEVSAGDLTVGQSIVYLDSPATTSSTTYTLRIKVNRGDVNAAVVSGFQSIVLIEVAA